MGGLHRFNIKKILADTGINTLVETGTGQGESIKYALRSGIGAIHSCEGEESLYSSARQLFSGTPEVCLYNSRSVSFLKDFTPTGATLYFLDAHFWGGADFGLLDRDDVINHKDSFPLCDELLLLLQKQYISKSIIIIDDARIYYDDEFQSGPCPPEWMCTRDLPALKLLLDKFAQLHKMVVTTTLHNEGYIIISPQSYPFSLEYFMVFGSDSSGYCSLEPGINGVTGLSLSRRMGDSRFGATYLRGNCLDVGGGKDSLAIYQHFFPLLKNVFRYDVEYGDGQYLENIPDNEFDCLYSSHCLEHLESATVALTNWLRVVKPGGFLVITIPDEDLYEQGFWPSRFAGEHHKATFTIQKKESWSPVSTNVLSLLAGLNGQVRIHKVELIDSGYHYGLNVPFDQTKLPSGECSIEIILQKI